MGDGIWLSALRLPTGPTVRACHRPGAGVGEAVSEDIQRRRDLIHISAVSTRRDNGRPSERLALGPGGQPDHPSAARMQQLACGLGALVTVRSVSSRFRRGQPLSPVAYQGLSDHGVFEVAGVGPACAGGRRAREGSRPSAATELSSSRCSSRPARPAEWSRGRAKRTSRACSELLAPTAVALTCSPCFYMTTTCT
jgi:hypothetical protein